MDNCTELTFEEKDALNYEVFSRLNTGGFFKKFISNLFCFISG